MNPPAAVVISLVRTGTHVVTGPVVDRLSYFLSARISPVRCLIRSISDDVAERRSYQTTNDTTAQWIAPVSQCSPNGPGGPSEKPSLFSIGPHSTTDRRNR